MLKNIFIIFILFIIIKKIIIKLSVKKIKKIINL